MKLSHNDYVIAVSDHWVRMLCNVSSYFVFQAVQLLCGLITKFQESLPHIYKTLLIRIYSFFLQIN